MSIQNSPLVRTAQRSGVRDSSVLQALYEVPRVAFLPPDQRDKALLDTALPIQCGQTTSQPSLVAMMIEALDVSRSDRVLEIGTGLGYEAALLSRLVRQVFTVEWFVELASIARENLGREGAANVEVVLGDGAAGLPEQAPFDAIIVACAAPVVPPAWVDQLAEGGRLVVPLGPGGAEEVVRYVKRGDALEDQKVLTPARFVPLLTGQD